MFTGAMIEAMAVGKEDAVTAGREDVGTVGGERVGIDEIGGGGVSDIDKWRCSSRNRDRWLKGLRSV